VWWGICIRLCYKFPTESNSERILKIGQYLVKLLARVWCLVFLTHGVVFDLPRHTWSLMNRFWTGQGPCHANLHKWGLAQSPSCDCGQRQTMNHVVDTCPLTKFEGRLNLLHKAVDDAVIWLESTATSALMKEINTSMHCYLWRCLFGVH